MRSPDGYRVALLVQRRHIGDGVRGQRRPSSPVATMMPTGMIPAVEVAKAVVEAFATERPLLFGWRCERTSPVEQLIGIQPVAPCDIGGRGTRTERLGDNAAFLRARPRTARPSPLEGPPLPTHY